jgi:hypothetical protein
LKFIMKIEVEVLVVIFFTTNYSSYFLFLSFSQETIQK